jgi:hypothetical protein
MFYPRYIIGGTGLEWLPFLDFLPGWTVMTVASVWRKSTEQSPMLNLASTAATGGALATAGAALAVANSASQKMTREPANDNSPQPQSRPQMIDIKPANNNAPKAAYAV